MIPTPAWLFRRLPGRSVRRGRVAGVGAAALVAGCVLAQAAQAGCLNVGRLWTCTEVGGTVVQMYCVGTGAVRACQELSRDEWLFIGRHEVLSQVLADADMSTAVQQSANLAQAGSSQAYGAARPSVLGTIRPLSPTIAAPVPGIAVPHLPAPLPTR